MFRRRGVLLGVLACAAASACGRLKVAPTPDAVPVRFAGPEATLIAKDATTSCTHQDGLARGQHRWCGFTVPAAEQGLAELWVIDVSAAAAGHVPVCDGTSDACLRLTSTLWQRAGASFEGDTLIYFADATSGPTQEFLGPIFAWRPGWSGGRQISSDRGFTCVGQRRSAAAACFDDPEGDPEKRDSAQVRVGLLDGPSGGPLPAIGRWPLRNDNDTAWETHFSPDGSQFALTAAPAIGKPQALVVVATADAGKAAPTPIIDDVAYVRISNDGAAIYFVRGLPVTADLYTADFPSGNGVRLVQRGILAYHLLGTRPQDQALTYDTDLGDKKGEFWLLARRDQAAPKSIFTYEDILDGAYVSPDLRYTVWMDFAFRGVVIHNDDLASCALDVEGEPAVYEPAFLDDASLIFWKEERPHDSSHRDGFFAAPDRCRPKTQFATDLEFATPVGKRAVIFADEIDGETKLTTLRYAAVTPDGTGLEAPGPVVIQRDVGAPVVFVGGEPLLLVYPDPTGLFVYGPVPR